MKFTELLNAWFAHKMLEREAPTNPGIKEYLVYLEARMEKVLRISEKHVEDVSERLDTIERKLNS